jgi:hypothetical protein
MPNLTLSSTATPHTIRPTETTFTNNTDHDVVLNSVGCAMPVEKGATTEELTATIISIAYDDAHYFIAGSSYTIVPGKSATLWKSATGLLLDIE